jgi:hypothetical protein
MAMTYDPARGVTVLFGGGAGLGVLGDLWEWDGNTWVQRPVVGPSPRQVLPMVYDSARGAALLFGGFGVDQTVVFRDTWAWDGTAWSYVAPTGPSARAGHAMAYDAGLNRTLLFGGQTFNSTFGDTWALNGAVWTQLNALGPPIRTQAAMAYDSARGVSVLLGGSPPDDRTWEFGAACAQPQFSTQPMSRTVNTGAPVTLRVEAGPLSYRWRKDGVDLVDGGTISGAATATLTIASAAVPDAGWYACAVSSACTSVVSEGARLTVGCYANCDGNPSPPLLTVADFTCFLNRFAAGDPYANCDGSTAPPVLNIADFVCFINLFAPGCP